MNLQFHLLPNKWNNPVSGLLRILRITLQFFFQSFVFQTSTDEQQNNRNACRDDAPQRAKDQRKSYYLNKRAHVGRMPDYLVQAGIANRVSALGLNAHGTREKLVLLLGDQKKKLT